MLDLPTQTIEDARNHYFVTHHKDQLQWIANGEGIWDDNADDTVMEFRCEVVRKFLACPVHTQMLEQLVKVVKNQDFNGRQEVATNYHAILSEFLTQKAIDPLRPNGKPRDFSKGPDRVCNIMAVATQLSRKVDDPNVATKKEERLEAIKRTLTKKDYSFQNERNEDAPDAYNANKDQPQAPKRQTGFFRKPFLDNKYNMKKISFKENKLAFIRELDARFGSDHEYKLATGTNKTLKWKDEHRAGNPRVQDMKNLILQNEQQRCEHNGEDRNDVQLFIPQQMAPEDGSKIFKTKR